MDRTANGQCIFFHHVLTLAKLPEIFSTKDLVWSWWNCMWEQSDEVEWNSQHLAHPIQTLLKFLGPWRPNINGVNVVWLSQKSETLISGRRNCYWRLDLSSFFFFLSFSPIFFRAVPTAYGNSQARSQIRDIAASLHHSHSNTGSDPHLWPTPQVRAKLDHQATGRG